MHVTRPATLADFVRDAAPFLMEREAEHGLMLGVAADANPVPTTAYWAIVRDDDGAIVAAALRTTEKLILSHSERPGAATLLADAALRDAPDLPGVIGPPAEVEEFVGRSGGEWADGIAHRIYECRHVDAPVGVPGHCRLARRDDRDTIVRWIRDFSTEAMGKPLAETTAAERTDAWRAVGALYVWEVDGGIVATAAAVAPTPHGIRVSGVYTPPEERGRGYASALTAAVTTRQLEAGRALVFLYADLANPISNRIYQRIGYVGVADVAMRIRL